VEPKTPRIIYNVKPFPVPDSVILDVDNANSGNRPFQKSPIVPLKDLSIETLHLLCDDFKRSVFKKAGKIDPKG
jgi:hypothetical protein